MLKRKRTSSTHSFNSKVISSVNSRERVESLWFPDGNLVLATKTQIFRVYLGVLAQQSAFFQVLLSGLKSADLICDIYDGVSVVYVFDYWNDLENFLMICFHGQ